MGFRVLARSINQNSCWHSDVEIQIAGVTGERFSQKPKPWVARTRQYGVGTCLPQLNIAGNDCGVSADSDKSHVSDQTWLFSFQENPNVWKSGKRPVPIFPFNLGGSRCPDPQARPLRFASLFFPCEILRTVDTATR